MSLKKWVAVGTLALTALASEGCTRYGKRESYPELERIQSTPEYRSQLYKRECPAWVDKRYCPETKPRR